MTVGKDWIERKKEEAAGGECNHNEGGSGEGGEEDFRKFVMGLERLDNACLQLDETLMIMKDFQF